MTLPIYPCPRCEKITNSKMENGSLHCSKCGKAKLSLCCEELIVATVDDGHGNKVLGCYGCGTRI